ncbi:protein GRIP [Cocos nucifera]|uniref:Protein GRIP n=1 Tax=Cocos nucifera TaxID=13894 RepID=A0A8K0N623_COCNU|nr:protein GRIP [Cocos nucifera]
MATGENTAISGKEERIGERVGGPEEDAAKPSEQFGDAYHKIDGPVANFDGENGIHEDNASPGETHDQLTQMVIELRLQNEYFKAQFGDLKLEILRSNDACKQNTENGEDKEASEQVNHLHEQIKCLNKEIQEHKETQKAAENALEHLRMSYSEADGKVQELTAKLVEAQQKMEHEIKERDDKYVELDSKFGRLHKRAKQRIQELQKEKDDLEARFNDVNMKAEQASSQQALAQQELERTRQQANEALRSMDTERQQLRTANNKLRDNIEEMRLTLEAKENALEGLRPSLLEKEQMLEQIRGSLQAAEEKRQASIAELSTKHQKQLESLETQLADVLSERSKAAETISSLQMLLAEKDSKIAEMDAASTGEAVRLGAALEELRGELNHLKDQHINRLESEFSAYKVRAHALLQMKDAELSAAKNSELIKAQEEAVREAEREVVMALAERDKAIHDLQDALVNHDKEISARLLTASRKNHLQLNFDFRDEALTDAEEQIRNITGKLDAATSQYLSEKETWQKNLESIEEHWRLRYHTLEAQNVNCIGDDVQEELGDLKLQYEKLKEEHYTFRDIADRAIEEKEKEITGLIEDNKNLRHSLELRPSVSSLTPCFRNAFSVCCLLAIFE